LFLVLIAVAAGSFGVCRDVIVWSAHSESAVTGSSADSHSHSPEPARNCSRGICPKSNNLPSGCSLALSAGCCSHVVCSDKCAEHESTSLECNQCVCTKGLFQCSNRSCSTALCYDINGAPASVADRSLCARCHCDNASWTCSNVCRDRVVVEIHVNDTSLIVLQVLINQWVLDNSAIVTHANIDYKSLGKNGGVEAIISFVETGPLSANITTLEELFDNNGASASVARLAFSVAGSLAVPGVLLLLLVLFI